MKPLNIVATVTRQLKWEPSICFSLYNTFTDSQKEQLFETIEPKLREDLAELINSAQEDTVLYFTLAYDDDDSLLAWAVVNAWQANTCSKAVMLLAVVADDPEDTVSKIVVEKALQEVKNIKYHGTVKDLKYVYCQKGKEFIESLITEYGYIPSPVY